jgi:outer membrane immunogenic protein
LSQNVSSSIDWLGTVRGRAGYLINPALLIYATGGLTYAGVSTSIQSYGISAYQGVNPDTFAIEQIGYALNKGNGSSSNIALGWNAGGGFEWMFMSNWSAKAEAFYYSLGGSNTSWATIGGPNLNYRSLRFPGWGLSNTTNVSYQGVVARLGVNYHFNLANVAPVVAKF